MLEPNVQVTQVACYELDMLFNYQSNIQSIFLSINRCARQSIDPRMLSTCSSPYVDIPHPKAGVVQPQMHGPPISSKRLSSNVTPCQGRSQPSVFLQKSRSTRGSSYPPKSRSKLGLQDGAQDVPHNAADTSLVLSNASEHDCGTESKDEGFAPLLIQGVPPG